MKRIIISIVFLCMVLTSVNAQLMRANELEKYSKEKYGEKWTEAAANLHKDLVLDKNNSLTYTQIIDCGDKTKDQIYVILNYWFTASFNDANSVIKLNDKENGCIIAKGYVENVAQHIGGNNRYEVSIEPIIKVDIKDYKIRVTYTIQGYNVIKIVGGGGIGLFGNALSGHNPNANTVKKEEVWVIEQCYPFVEKDNHKKTSSKAFIMTHAYSNVIMDKIEETIKTGLIGNETEDW